GTRQEQQSTQEARVGSTSGTDGNSHAKNIETKNGAGRAVQAPAIKSITCSQCAAIVLRSAQAKTKRSEHSRSLRSQRFWSTPVECFYSPPLPKRWRICRVWWRCDSETRLRTMSVKT